MMTTVATAGPWTITEHSWSVTGIYADSVQIALIDIYDEATEENQEALEARTAANATLIAASPELLAACMHALAYDKAIQGCADTPDAMFSYCTAQGDTLDTLYAAWIGAAQAAVAKATERAA